MTAKFIQFFDILSGKEDEFNHFASKNYIPGINEMGLTHIVGSWNVAAGEGPFCVLESTADSVENIHRLLIQDEFTKLNHLLHFLVTNYKTKVLAPTGHMPEQSPSNLNYRFNHHYNINYTRYDEYNRFIKKEHIPIMDTLGITIIGTWYVAIGPGPNIVVEGSCASARQIVESIGTVEYRKLTSKFFDLVSDFGSKILVPTGLLSQ